MTHYKKHAPAGPLMVAVAILLLLVVALAGCEQSTWLKADDPEIQRRIKICTDAGQRPVIEMWGARVAVHGCRP